MRLVVVSNRLPVVLDQGESGWNGNLGAGGLVSALTPVLRRWKGLWIGWPGSLPVESTPSPSCFEKIGQRLGFTVEPVYLTPQEEKDFYQGFSNEIIWPLFHDLQSRCNFVPEYWTAYQAVEKKFADSVAEHVRKDDLIWVQDYHLMGLGRCLRGRGFSNKLGFFLHIPFPPPDIFCKLPWRTDILTGLLQYDTLGFQTPRDRDNFFDCIRKLLPEAHRRSRRAVVSLEYSRHLTHVGVFPIGIDYREFADLAASPAVTQRVTELRAQLTPGESLAPGQSPGARTQIVLAVDRLDYTKGIPDRLKAFRLALVRYPELHRKIALLQVVVPSRESVPEYQELKGEIERLVSQINGELTQPGWVPIHHVFRSIDREELVAYYRVADMALITPLKDGMNLVAKEYCACQVEGDGVLILSEFAGAAIQFKADAVLVNPYDLDRVADAVHRAATMNLKQRRPGMRRLRRIAEQQDVYWWVNRFLAACGIHESGNMKLDLTPAESVGSDKLHRGLEPLSARFRAMANGV
ncbi:MAG TPA: trehalose-6-phosphate synthase [Phycisphaerae bacterium]|nr:trehalose-6-phosphate synthase [Phycisphaerae bacterium]